MLTPEELTLKISQASSGSTDAFEELIRVFDSRLQYYVRRFVKDYDLADEIVQSTWAEAYFGLKKLKVPQAFTSWLYRILKRQMSTALKKRSLYASIFPTAIDELNFEPAAEIPDAMFTAELAKMIHDALDRLSPERREVLVLRFIEEMDYESIAGVVGVSLGTIKSRIFYGKRDLKAIIEKIGR
jgi:RNA polymerase sigma-70 factor (ECF subfamily)